MMNRFQFKNMTFAIVLLISVISFAYDSSAAKNQPAMQDVKPSLFKEANAALKIAQKAQADILAPKNFGEAMKFYRQAEDDLKKGKNLEDIRKKLRGAVSYLHKATDATKLAEVTFTSTIKARNDAKTAEASRYATELWRQAEEKFAEAGAKLEDGNINAAKKRAGESETVFRQAELAAIKANYLSETWQLLDKAERTKVKDRAPKTLAKTQDLIQRAEKELNTNRYDTDVARNLAQQAKYEAKHAIYLAEVLQQMKDSRQTVEDILLASEKPLQQISEKIDVVAEFDGGYGNTTAAIINYVSTYQDSASKLSQELAERDQQISDLQARVNEMETQLGEQEREKSALAQRIEAQKRIREQFASVEQMFGREEARVMREGNDITIRLVSLNFASGKSTIDAQHFGLLTKVQKALRVFPESMISIEGHTDSFGSDEKNLQLSKERAEAVKQYILANTGMEPSRIESIGYGESKPIANNETAEGRTRNRRIEVVITPNVGGTF